MIDIKKIIADPEGIKKALLKRMDSVDFDELLEWYNERQSIQSVVEEKRAKRKKLSSEIGQMIKSGGDADTVKATVKDLGNEISSDEVTINSLSEKIKNFLDYLPNIPEEGVPAGGKECNEVIKTGGSRPEFDFKTMDHVDLATSLGLIDYKRGAKLGGTGKWIYTADGSLLEWGLINYFVQNHIRNGYRFMMPPHLLRQECGYVAGQFPKFKDDVFYLQNEKGEPTHFLLPTAETALANCYADEIIPADQLPLKMFAYTPCYRKEAGSYRTNERGTIRGNQFNKVELFHIATPETSEQQFQQMLDEVTSLMDSLGLHYQMSRLAAGDVSEAMAKTYDVEVWLPSINDYKEVSSISTSHTFQAIRGNIRFKDPETGKNRFVHTLNGSGMATSRLLPAILEQFQTSDGSVKVPEVLVPYVGKEMLTLQG
jgi:seryl-tRNA synthetase